jgi:hypothetical protein
MPDVGFDGGEIPLRQDAGERLHWVPPQFQITQFAGGTSNFIAYTAVDEGLRLVRIDFAPAVEASTVWPAYVEIIRLSHQVLANLRERDYWPCGRRPRQEVTSTSSVCGLIARIRRAC